MGALPGQWGEAAGPGLHDLQQPYGDEWTLLPGACLLRAGRFTGGASNPPTPLRQGHPKNPREWVPRPTRGSSLRVGLFLPL